MTAINRISRRIMKLIDIYCGIEFEYVWLQFIHQQIEIKKKLFQLSI